MGEGGRCEQGWRGRGCREGWGEGGQLMTGTEVLAYW